MGFVRLRNPLVYPGGLAGFDPTHFAGGSGIRFSGVATGSGFQSILTGKPGTVTGTVTNVQTSVGSAIQTTASAAGYTSFPGVNDTLTGATIAVIYTPTAAQSNGVLFANNGVVNTTFIDVQTLASSIRVYFGPSVNVDTAFTWTIGTTYFICISVSGTTFNIVIKNLQNGKTFTSTVTSTYTLLTPTQSAYTVGGWTASANSMRGNLSAVMYSVNNPLSLSQLRVWAEDPWGFWYQTRIRTLVLQSLGPIFYYASFASQWVGVRDLVSSAIRYGGSVHETLTPATSLAANERYSGSVGELWRPTTAFGAVERYSGSIGALWRPSTAFLAAWRYSASLTTTWRPATVFSAAVRYSGSVSALWSPSAALHAVEGYYSTVATTWLPLDAASVAMIYVVSAAFASVWFPSISANVVQGYFIKASLPALTVTCDSAAVFGIGLDKPFTIAVGSDWLGVVPIAGDEV